MRMAPDLNGLIIFRMILAAHLSLILFRQNWMHILISFWILIEHSRLLHHGYHLYLLIGMSTNQQKILWAGILHLPGWIRPELLFKILNSEAYCRISTMSISYLQMIQPSGADV